MSKQHHFVVLYDTEFKKFYVDDETQFFEGTIWNKDTEEWTFRTEDEADETLDETIYNTLHAVLAVFNEYGSLQEEED